MLTTPRGLAYCRRSDVAGGQTVADVASGASGLPVATKVDAAMLSELAATLQSRSMKAFVAPALIPFAAPLTIMVRCFVGILLTGPSRSSGALPLRHRQRGANAKSLKTCTPVRWLTLTCPQCESIVRQDCPDDIKRSAHPAPVRGRAPSHEPALKLWNATCWQASDESLCSRNKWRDRASVFDDGNPCNSRSMGRQLDRPPGNRWTDHRSRSSIERQVFRDSYLSYVSI
jgi:hypothetical protein